MSKKIKLGVNIDHVASLRQARGTNYPEIAEAARICENAGATGITVHLREDRRHIQDNDVKLLRKSIKVPLNLEMACNKEIIDFALKVKPDEVCIVPEKRKELTTEGGLDVAATPIKIKRLVKTMKDAGIEPSLFIDPTSKQIKAAFAAGAKVIELHTGTYCDATGKKAERELRKLISAAEMAHSLGIKVNAGHGINIYNIKGILQVPHLDTLNIGHSIISRAVFLGLDKAVKEMLELIKPYGN